MIRTHERIVNTAVMYGPSPDFSDEIRARPRHSAARLWVIVGCVGVILAAVAFVILR